MKTVSIYQKSDAGMAWIGTFTPRKFYSVRAIAEQFKEKNPAADMGQMFMSRRIFVDDQWRDDGDLIPLSGNRPSDATHDAASEP